MPNAARHTATFASPPPNVATNCGVCRKRSNPGGLSLSMISPNVTTLGISALPCGANARDDALGVGAEAAKIAGPDRFGVCERASDENAPRPSRDPTSRVVERDAAGRHQLDVRQRSPHVL